MVTSGTKSVSDRTAWFSHQWRLLLALLGLTCQQRRNQALEARCSDSANILGKGPQGKEGDGAIELHPISLFRQHRFISDLQCTITRNGAHFVHASVRQGFPISQWCPVSCVRGGRPCRPTSRQRLSPNLSQWPDCTGTEILGEWGKGGSPHDLRCPPGAIWRFAYCFRTLL
jgi:hypothetical protein